MHPPRPHHRARPHGSSSGFSLVEVLIVVLIMALALTGVTMGIGALTRTQLRSACMKVVAASRYSYNRAIVQGNTVRIRFDFEKSSIALEEAHGKVTLAKADDGPRSSSDEQQDVSGVDPWEAARARLEKTFEPTLGRSPFGPIRNSDGQTLAQYKPQPLGDGIRVVRLFVPHERQPIDAGHGSIYFFPGGRSEHAVVQLSDDGGDTIYSIEIHPLTGRGKVHNEPYQPQEMDAGEFSELRDPG